MLFAAAGKPARAACTSEAGVFPFGASSTDTAINPNSTACDLPHNDLSPAAITGQGSALSAPLLEALAYSPIDDAALDSIEDAPLAAPLLRKIVSCALPAKTLREFHGAKLEGQLGLCPEWGTTHLKSPRREECQELVSSCVLAAVNAVQARVIFSLRSSELPLGERKSVPVEDQSREKLGTPIAGFLPCSPSNPAANCGFLRGYVGRCIAGKTVEVRAATKHTKIRHCDGLYGCDQLESKPAATSGNPVSNEAEGSLTFQCPRNGPAPHGYYGLMVKPASPAARPRLTVRSDGGSYPASEREVFTFAEGAFYGNLFESRQSCETRKETGPLAGDEYACYGNGWANGVDEMNERFCTLPGRSCFTNKPMACFLDAGNRCANDAKNGGAFAQCEPTAPGSKTSWSHPLTTYLNNPCDLSHDPKDCDPQRRFSLPGDPDKCGPKDPEPIILLKERGGGPGRGPAK